MFKFDFSYFSYGKHNMSRLAWICTCILYFEDTQFLDSLVVILMWFVNFSCGIRVFTTTIKYLAKFLLTGFEGKVTDERNGTNGKVRGRELWSPSERETAFRLKELRFYLGDDISVLTIYNCGVLRRRKM